MPLKLVKQREIERKKAIAEGKMDDPLVPKRLEEAITMVGTCMDMCPRFERYRRERENNLDRWEVVREHLHSFFVLPELLKIGRSSWVGPGAYSCVNRGRRLIPQQLDLAHMS